MSAAETMTETPAEATAPPHWRNLAIRLALLGVWAVAVLWLAWHHVPWRDEVRALTIALSGDTTLDMLRNLHGEGHPALWYLLLRWGHALMQSPVVLPALAFILSFAAMAVLVFKSPLKLWTIALFMFGGLGLFEYTVSARNYGMAALVLFVFAALYPRWRDRGVTMGLVLFVLCNTNVPANFLACGLLGFWLVEVFGEEGFRWHRKYGWWMANAAVAAAGAAVCFLTVFPTVHDAASIDHPGGLGLGDIFGALTTSVVAFPDLGAANLLDTWAVSLVLTLLLTGSLAGLLRSPGAFLAGLGVLVIFKLFYLLVYPGGYRHQGLLIAFLLTLYWLVAAGRGDRWSDRLPALRRLAERAAQLGGIFFVLLLALQLAQSFRYVEAAVEGKPYSRVAELAAVIEREGLGDAIVLGHPDVMVEALPYYTANPIYLLREQKYGAVVRFTAHARTDLKLDDILTDARRIAAETGKKVVVVLQHRLDPTAPPRRYAEGYLGFFYTDPDQERRFLSATRLLASFGPAITDERYDVYLLTGG